MSGLLATSALSLAPLSPVRRLSYTLDTVFSIETQVQLSQICNNGAGLWNDRKPEGLDLRGQ